LRRYRKRTTLLFVAGALGLPALALSLLGVKVVRDFADIGNTVRSEYGSYLSDIAATALRDAYLDREMVNMVAARFVPPESPEEVITFLNRFHNENPLYLLTFFVLPEGLVFYSNLDPDRETSYRPLPGWVQDAILDSMRKQGVIGNVPSGLQHLATDDPREPLQITYFTLNGSDGRLLGTAGFLWDLDHVRADGKFLERVLRINLRDRPDLFRGAFFESPAGITLLDQNGKPFYSTEPVAGGRYVSLRPLDRVLPFYKVGIQLRDDRFDAWIRTVVGTSLAMIATMFLLIVIALIFALRFVLHEMELAELKSALVGNVSHELKTPLALIRLFSETLEMGRAGSPEKEKEFLRIINKESERLTHLINNVLDVGRIEQGRKSYVFAPTDLAAVVRDTLAAYEYSLAKQGFEVETDIEDGLPPAPADADALTQALINLMENAIKYSPQDRHLRVALRRRGGQAAISVTDRGMGIPPSEKDRIFEAFYRVERGLVHNVKGSGLGLSLVKHIVEAHRGRVSVDSRPGEGSTFTMVLPLDGRGPEHGGGS